MNSNRIKSAISDGISNSAKEEWKQVFLLNSFHYDKEIQSADHCSAYMRNTPTRRKNLDYSGYKMIKGNKLIALIEHS